MPRTADRIRRWLGLRDEGDDLVDLIRAARENEAIRSQLISILGQDQVRRESLLGSWIAELRLESAPQPLISALLALRSKDVAERSLQILKGP